MPTTILAKSLGKYHVHGPTLEMIMHTMDSGLGQNQNPKPTSASLPHLTSHDSIYPATTISNITNTEDNACGAGISASTSTLSAKGRRNRKKRRQQRRKNICPTDKHELLVTSKNCVFYNDQSSNDHHHVSESAKVDSESLVDADSKNTSLNLSTSASIADNIHKEDDTDINGHHSDSEDDETVQASRTLSREIMITRNGQPTNFKLTQVQVPWHQLFVPKEL
ncbi:unnamed protein product [Protopolystoma xenopodis]|uniref:Uncharacterized protein n=1 Tax=Protopolystoma xenopodis TaxID=117903 RepID=A0A3S5A135_9PLAT|nr:unnamed protein product [Protopolystoma xenopodis]